MSAPLPPPRKKRLPRRAGGASRALNAAATQSASGDNSRGADSSARNARAPENQPEAVHPARKGPKKIRSLPPSRSARLSKLRDKVQSRRVWLPIKSREGTGAGGDVELVAMRGFSEVGPKDNAGPKGNVAPESAIEPGPASKEHSIRKLLCAVFIVLTATIVCALRVVDIATVAITTGGQLGAMNCARLMVAPSIMYFSFSSFFVVATLFRPTRRELASMRHRKTISLIALTFVCAIAIVAGSIGYPHGVCPTDCMCGVCEGSEPIELPEKWNGSTCAEKETTTNVTRNATTGGGLNALMLASSNAMTRSFTSSDVHSPRRRHDSHPS